MSTKVCFKCGLELPSTEFYKHSQMGDGTLNKCKACTKKDVHENYNKNRKHYSAYEKERSKAKHRKFTRLVSAKNRRLRNPEKERNRRLFVAAVKRGEIKKTPCVFCGETKVQGHHEDYNKPLEIVWVCFKCHREKFHNQVVVSEHL